MTTYVIYDIENERLRAKIADICLDYGLERIQYSGFRGQLSANHRQELTMKLRARFGSAQGCIHILPLCEKDESCVVQIGQTLAQRAARDKKPPK